MVRGRQPPGVIEASQPCTEHREGKENGADSNPHGAVGAWPSRLEADAIRLKTTGVIVTLALAMMAPVPATAQQSGRVGHIGVLSNGFPPSSPQYLRPRFDAFLQGLRELGYVEGENIAIEWRFASGRDDQLPALAAELVQRKVDVIIAAGTPPALAARQASGTVPIVMAASGDPVGSGLVRNLGRPGGNVTGLSLMTAEVYGKRLELLKEAVPRLTRVAILYNPTNPPSVADWRHTEIAARSLGVQIVPVKARDPGDFDGAVAMMVRERVHALVVTSDLKYVGQRARLVRQQDAAHRQVNLSVLRPVTFRAGVGHATSMGMSYQCADAGPYAGSSHSCANEREDRR